LSDEMTRFKGAELHQFTCDAMVRCGVPKGDAVAVADMLGRADMMGVDSHGVAHLEAYVNTVKSGKLAAVRVITTLHDSPTGAALEGGGGLGAVVAQIAMDLAIRKAEAMGMAAVTVRNTGHAGMMGHWALQASERGYVGIALTQTPSAVAPAGGMKAMLGTNPIAVSAPGKNDHPFLYDGATPTVAMGKLEIARRRGKKVPLGWVQDKDGRPTDDPCAPWDGGMMLPLGSFAETSAHKGYGLGVMVDVLSGLLSGSGTSWEQVRGRGIYNHFFLVMKVEQFRPLDDFRQAVDRMQGDLRATPPAPGINAVQAPGDPEFRALADRTANGVPLDAAVVASLGRLATLLEIPPLRPVESSR